jgi:hypothetical protein
MFLVGDERIDVAAGDFLFAPRDIPHAYVVRSERARILSTISPAGIEQLFVSLGTPAAGAEPPTDVGDAADARDGAPVRSPRRRDPRPAARAERPLLASSSVVWIFTGEAGRAQDPPGSIARAKRDPIGARILRGWPQAEARPGSRRPGARAPRRFAVAFLP